MGNGTVFIEAKCDHTNSNFYIKYSKGADGVWVLLSGEKSIANDEKTGISDASIDIGQARSSPRYKCPYCGNRSFIKCNHCSQITCYDGQSTNARCAQCKNEGKVTGRIQTLEGGSAEGQ